MMTHNNSSEPFRFLELGFQSSPNDGAMMINKVEDWNLAQAWNHSFEGRR